jgi:hypothetical protein
MRRTLIVFLRALFVVALMASLIGCGGGGDAEPTRDEAAAPDESEAPEETTEEESSSEPESDDGAAAFCDAVEASVEAEIKLSSELQQAAGSPEANQEAYERFVAKSDKQLDAIVDSAPAVIKEAAKAYVQSFRDFAAGDVSQGTKNNKKAGAVVDFARSNCF